MTAFENFLFENFGNESFEPGLCRISLFIKEDLQILNSKIISVAGTNGKGECCYTLGKLFQGQKISYGLWSSPHVESVSERFEFDGKLVPENELLEISQALIKRLETLKVKLSYYEFLFSLFIKISTIKKPLYLILEVGLGGRLDAVNAIDADLSAITSISRDHQEFLGNSLKEILFEKFMISRANKPLITALPSKYLRSQTKLLVNTQKCVWFDLYEHADAAPRNFSKSNRLLALMIFKKITNISDLPTIIELMSFSFRARFDRILYGNKTVVYCGAHNMDGLRKMFSLIDDQRKHEFKSFTLVASFSKRNFEDLVNMVKVVEINKCLFSKNVFTCFDHEKSAGSDHLSGINFQKDWKELFKHEDKLFITGSYYWIGQVKEYFNSLSDHI
jgi:dihydrofolate synthase/folylpolyglutamate synthase